MNRVETDPITDRTELLARLRALAAQAASAIHLQVGRLNGEGQSFPEQWCWDLELLVLAIRRLETAADAIGKSFRRNAETQQAASKFRNAIGGVEKLPRAAPFDGIKSPTHHLAHGRLDGVEFKLGQGERVHVNLEAIDVRAQHLAECLRTQHFEVREIPRSRGQPRKKVFARQE